MGLILTVIACDDSCPVGLECVRSCPLETIGMCSADGLCLCQETQAVMPINVDGKANASPPTHGGALSCARAGEGDVVISEVMLDGEPTESEEFIEIVNVSDEPIRLNGLSIWGSRGQRVVRRVAFLEGCLDPRTALVMYADRTRWISVPQTTSEIVADMGRFGFSNSSDFYISLMGDDGLVLDEIAGSSQMIEPGVSLTRVDVFADNRSELNLHHIMGFGSKSSPGFCPNGARYDAYCSVTMRSDYECIAPTAGMLRINEILIDGAEDESEEFVELINQTSHPLSLAGLELWSNRGLELVPRVRFYAGCLPPKGMVAL